MKISQKQIAQKKMNAQKTILIPTSIFTDRTLKVLEALVEYLKESKQLTYHQIAALLNRDDRTIWTVYHRAGIKRRPHMRVAPPSAGAADAVFIPSTALCDRSLKALEAIAEYLKEEKQLTYHQIALLLNRDDRTIWTVVHRAQKKRAQKKQENDTQAQ